MHRLAILNEGWWNRAIVFQNAPTTLQDLINASSREIQVIENAVLQLVIKEFSSRVYTLTAADDNYLDNQ